MVIPVTVCLFVVHQHGVFDLQDIIFSDGGGSSNGSGGGSSGSSNKNGNKGGHQKS